MKNAFLRIGYTCAPLLIAGCLMTASAATRDLARVTLSQPVMVGATTLPGGQYTITEEGNNVFLIHSANGSHAMVFGQPTESNTEAAKTEVILKNDGEAMRLDQLRFEGQTGGVEFER